MTETPQWPETPDDQGDPMLEPVAGPAPLQLRRDGELHLYFPVEVVVVDSQPGPEQGTVQAGIWQELYDALA